MKKLSLLNRNLKLMLLLLVFLIARHQSTGQGIDVVTSVLSMEPGWQPNTSINICSWETTIKTIVTNPSTTIPLSNVIIDQLLPAGVSAGNIPSTNTCSTKVVVVNGSVQYTFPSIPPNTTCEIEIPVYISCSTTPVGNVLNIINSSATNTISVLPNVASFQVTKPFLSIENFKDDAGQPINQLPAQNLVKFKALSGNGSDRYREFDIKVTSGVIDLFELTLTPELEIERTGFQLTGINANGTIAIALPRTIFTTPSTGTEILTFDDVKIQDLFGPGHSKMYNNEIIRVREYFNVVECSPTTQDATTFTVNWACLNSGTTTVQNCNSNTTTRSINTSVINKSVTLAVTVSTPFTPCSTSNTDLIYTFTNPVSAGNALGANTKTLETIKFPFDTDWLVPGFDIFLRDPSTGAESNVTSFPGFLSYDAGNKKYTLDFDALTSDPFTTSNSFQDALEDKFIQDTKFNEFGESKSIAIVFKAIQLDFTTGHFYNSNAQFNSCNKDDYNFMLLGDNAYDFVEVKYYDMCDINPKTDLLKAALVNHFPVTSLAESNKTDYEQGDEVIVDFYYQYAGNESNPSPFRFVPPNTPNIFGCDGSIPGQVTYEAIVSISDKFSLTHFPSYYYSDPNDPATAIQIGFSLIGQDPDPDPEFVDNQLYRITDFLSGLPLNLSVNGKIRLDLKLIDCPINTGDYSVFTANIQAFCNGCDLSAYTISCMRSRIKKHCPGVCAGEYEQTAPQFTKGFTFDRNSFGWTDNSMSSNVNATTPGVSLNRVYPCDNIHVTSIGGVSPLGPQIPVAPSLSYQIVYDSPAHFQFFEFVSCSLLYRPNNPANSSFTTVIVDPLTDLGGHFNTTTPCSPCTLTVNFDISAPTLAGLQSAASNGGEFTMTMDLKVKSMINGANPPVSTPSPGYYILDNMRAEFVSGNMESCDDWGDNLIVMNLGVKEVSEILEDDYSGYAAGLCGKYFRFRTEVTGGLDGLDDFPTEFRPVMKWPDLNAANKIKLTFPTAVNSSYRVNSSFFELEQNPSWPLPLPVDVIDNNSDLEFNGYFENSILKPWPLLEKNGKPVIMNLYGAITNECPVPFGTNPSPPYAVDFPYQFRTYNSNGNTACIYQPVSTSKPYPVSAQYTIQLDREGPLVDIESTVSTFQNVKLKLVSSDAVRIDNVWLRFTAQDVDVLEVWYNNLPVTSTVYNSEKYWVIPQILVNTEYKIKCKIQLLTCEPGTEKLISVDAGYNCLGFTMPTNACANSNQLQFNIKPLDSELDMDVDMLNSNVGTVCSLYQYEVILRSIDNGDVENPALMVHVPAGVTIGPNPYCTVGSSNVQVPLSYTGTGPYLFNLVNSNIYNGDGIKGHGGQVKVFLSLTGACSLQGTTTPNFVFQPIGFNICGDALLEENDEDNFITFLPDPLPSSDAPLIHLSSPIHCGDPISFSIQLNNISSPTYPLAVHFVGLSNNNFTVSSVPAGSTTPGSGTTPTKTNWDFQLNEGGNIEITGFFIPQDPNFCGEFQFTLNSTLVESPSSCCSQFQLPALTSNIFVDACCPDNGSCIYIPKPEVNNYGKSIISTPDGGIAIAGVLHQQTEDNDLYMVKYNAALAMELNCLWGEKSNEKDANEVANSIIKRGDFYYVVGTVYLSERDHDIAVTKLDLSGNIVWSKRFGEPDKIEVGTKIIDLDPMCSDHILVVGYTNTFDVDHSDMLALQLRTNGTIAKYKIFGQPGTFEKAYDAVLLPFKKGCIIAGEFSDNGNSDVMAIAIDGSIDLGSSLIVQGGNNEVAYSVTYIDENVYLAGKTNSFGIGGDDVYLVTTDYGLTGVQATATFGQSNDEVAYSIIKTDDDNLVLAGKVDSGQKDGLVLKVNPFDNLVVWSNRTLFDDKDVEFSSVTQVLNGDFVATGYYQVSENDRDIFISRIPVEGQSCCMENYELFTGSGGEAISGCDERLENITRVNFGTPSTYYFEELICGSNSGSEIREMPSPVSMTISYGDYVLKPNPFMNTTTLVIPEDVKLNNASIGVYDLMGNLIKEYHQIENYSNTIDCSMLSPGVYLLRFKNEGRFDYQCKMIVL